MPSLREVQTGLARALTDASAVEVLPWVDGAGLGPVRRLQLYRNNARATLAGALADVYPVVRRLVGDRFFRQVADRYAREVPSGSGDLHAFGDAFPELLEALAETRELPYLPDVARLEWACHEVLYGADHGPLAPASLAWVPESQWGLLRFRLHPASRIMASPYPALRIWQVNQDGWGGAATVDLAEGASQVLVVRPRREVELWPLSPGEHALVGALSEGCTLLHAMDGALSVEPSIDGSGSLTRLVAGGAIVEARL